MRRKKVLFIVNPRSGKGQIRNALLDIADIFIKGGLDVTLYVTQKPQDASRVVEKRATKFDPVIPDNACDLRFTAAAGT